MGAPAGTRPKRPLVGRETDSSSDSSCDHVDCRFSNCSQNCWTSDGQLRCSLIPRCKLEDLQQKAQEVRKERERMFEEHARERNVLHQHSLEAAKRLALTRAASLKTLEHDLELLGSPRAAATQREDIERRTRDESLVEYRKKFDGVRGFSKASGRVRTFRKTRLGVPKVSFRSKAGFKAANPKRTNTLSARRQRRRRMLI